MYADGDTNQNGPNQGQSLRSMLDVLPVPSTTQPVTEPGKHEVANTLTDEPTLSHALATDDHEVKGLAQVEHDEEVVDLGWNEKKQNIAAPLVGGLENEDLWLLVRRFNKVQSCRLRHKGIRLLTALINNSKYTMSKKFQRLSPEI